MLTKEDKKTLTDLITAYEESKHAVYRAEFRLSSVHKEKGVFCDESVAASEEWSNEMCKMTINAGRLADFVTEKFSEIV